eukprot:6240476-Ditylum_brightwellii.AAC.1
MQAFVVHTAATVLELVTSVPNNPGPRNNHHPRNNNHLPRARGSTSHPPLSFFFNHRQQHPPHTLDCPLGCAGNQGRLCPHINLPNCTPYPPSPRIKGA